MIIDLFLNVLSGILNILLLPLSVIEVAVDFFSSMPIIFDFLQVVAYILPWWNLLPLILIIVSVFGFRITISFIKTLWQLIPGF